MEKGLGLECVSDLRGADVRGDTFWGFWELLETGGGRKYVTNYKTYEISLNEKR